MGGSETASERYGALGIEAALRRPWDYPTACHELALILRLAFSHLPKPLQSLIFAHVLLAFRNLPEVHTGYTLASANVLLQAAEFALPKQRKVLAVSEYKQSVVAHKRRARIHQGEHLHVPFEVILHIFSFLDVRSLVAASLVCWGWNAAASDEVLWQKHYNIFFGSLDMSFETMSGNKRVDVLKYIEDSSIFSKFRWKNAFRRSYTDGASFRFTSNRAFCSQCRSIIWLSSISCHWSHYCDMRKNQDRRFKHILPNKVVDYILENGNLTVSSSDTDDSDSDEEPPASKLWAYPRLRKK